MLEILSVHGLLNCVLETVLASRAESRVSGGLQALQKRLQDHVLPLERPLQDAYGRAWFAATLLLVDACCPREGVHGLLRQSLVARKERALQDGGALGAAELRVLVSPEDGSPDALRRRLEEGVVDTLTGLAGSEPLPAMLLYGVTHGWFQPVPSGDPERVTWFTALRAYFSSELRKDSQLSQQLLTDLVAASGSGALAPRDLEPEVTGFRADLAELFRQMQDFLASERGWLAEEVQERQRRIDAELVRHGDLFGRRAQGEWLDELLRRPSGVLMVTAPAGFGKTALLSAWRRELTARGCVVASHFFVDRIAALRSTRGGLRSLLWQVMQYHRELCFSLPSDKETLEGALSRRLRERPGYPDMRLVVLLDGLDEAEEPLALELEDPLPEHVYVIASARAGSGECPLYLRDWLRIADHRHLDRLSLASLRDWIGSSPEPALRRLAADDGFVQRLAGRTGGFPLYVRYLLEELAQAARRGREPAGELEEMPAGFREYVERALERLEEPPPAGLGSDVARRCFATLAAALGPLSRGEIKRLTGARDLDLKQLLRHQGARRWLTAAGEANDAEISFAHPLLARAFREALGDDAEEAGERLLEWCRDWENNRSPYAVTFYPFHLEEYGDWDELSDLLATPAFFQSGEDLALLRWYRFEKPEWQRLLCRWVAHLMDQPDRERAAVHVAEVYLDAYWWWGEFLSWPLNDQLIASFQTIRGWDRNPLLSALVLFHESYPLGIDWRTRAGWKGRWDMVRLALERVRAATGCGGDLGALVAAAGGNDPLARKRLRVRLLTGFYLAEAAEMLGDPRALAASRESLRLLALRDAQGEPLLPDDQWSRAWVYFQLADAAARREKPSVAEKCAWRALRAAEEAESSEDDTDWEVRGNLFRALADAYRLAGQAREEQAAWELAWIHTFRFHNQPHPSPPDRYSLAVNRRFLEQWTDRLLELDAGTALRWARAMRRLWADGPPFGPRPEPADDELSAALAARDSAALGRLLLPPPPEEGDRQTPELIYQWYRTLDEEIARRRSLLSGNPPGAGNVGGT